jgi:hypothetical protein
MGMFGDDPKDQTIQILQDQVKHLQGLLADRDKTILALTDAQAYRLTHPHEGDDGPPTAPPDLGPWRPNKTLDEVKESFGES